MNPTKERDIKKEYKYTSQVNAVFNYLNLRTGKHYSQKPGTKNFVHIHNRLEEGYSVEDCRKVIDAKCGQWLRDEKMKVFLRPGTLFIPSHFDDYLQEWEPEEIIDETENDDKMKFLMAFQGEA